MKTGFPLLLCATVIGCATFASAQTVGGSETTLYHWEGQTDLAYFGTSVVSMGDRNGDGFEDVAVGSPNLAGSGAGSVGVVYLYSGADGSSAAIQGFEIDGRFGFSIDNAGDIDGDGVNDLLVSEPRSHPTPNVRGAVFILSGATTAILQQWNAADLTGNFGFTVASIGDLDGDGLADVLVGEPSASFGGGIRNGSVHAYSSATGAEIYRWNGINEDEDFGWSIANAHDVNGDGIDDILVGAPNAGVNHTGKAYVYSGADGIEIHSWRPSQTTPIDFGFSVDGAGDVNNDGFADLIVGAPFAPNAAGDVYSGRVFVYSGMDGTRLYKWEGSLQDQLGLSVSAGGDIDRDGFADMLVGVPFADPSGFTDAGSIQVYSGADGSLMHQRDGAAALEALGYTVATAGDMNADGFDDFAAASIADLGGYTAAGYLNVYSVNPFMALDLTEVSASAGGLLTFDLSFSAAAAGDNYKVLISDTGTGPTTYGVEIPLNLDPMVIDTFSGNYLAPVSNMHGVLDANGQATATLTVPAGTPAVLVGNVYYAAAIASQPGQLPEYSSVAVMVTILP